jgi:hypothetical protein
VALRRKEEVMAKSKELGMQAFDQTLLNLYYKARQHKRVRLHRQILPMIFGRLSSPRVMLKKIQSYPGAVSGISAKG